MQCFKGYVASFFTWAVGYRDYNWKEYHNNSGVENLWIQASSPAGSGISRDCSAKGKKWHPWEKMINFG